MTTTRITTLLHRPPLDVQTQKMCVTNDVDLLTKKMPQSTLFIPIQAGAGRTLLNCRRLNKISKLLQTYMHYWLLATENSARHTWKMCTAVFPALQCSTKMSLISTCIIQRFPSVTPHNGAKAHNVTHSPFFQLIHTLHPTSAAFRLLASNTRPFLHAGIRFASSQLRAAVQV